MHINRLENNIIDFAVRHVREHDQSLLDEFLEPPVLEKYAEAIQRTRRRIEIADRLLRKLMIEIANLTPA